MRFDFSFTVIITAALVLLLAAAPLSASEQFRPNIVFLNFDDADTEMLSMENMEQHYPALSRLAERAVHFTNAHCTTPFCAPSRAALFTGQYAFNTDCKVNSGGIEISNGFNGGYSAFQAGGHHENELGVWMRDAGYETIHVGKYHHSGFDDVVPEGWDSFCAVGGNLFFDSRVFTNIGVASPRQFRIGANAYITHFNRGLIRQSLQQHFERGNDKPFFLSWAPLAPHRPGGRDLTKMVEPRYRSYGESLRQPTGDPDYDESDMSDKPAHIARAPITASERGFLQDTWINRIRSIKSVDDALQQTINQIEAAGELDNTIFVVTSDNGYSLGHHRQVAKKDPYNRCTSVPLMVSLPDSSSARFADHLIAHIDICPTILDLGVVPVPDSIDGKSFSRLVDGSWQGRARDWQRSIMIENWSDKYTRTGRSVRAYVAERYFDSIYVAWANGAREYYDLVSDPFQLTNQFDSLPSSTKNVLAQSLRDFRVPNVLPISTFTAPAHGSDATRSMTMKGFLEDNSAPVAARLFVRSFRTGKFFDGRTWTESPSWFTVPADSTDGCISTWSTELNVFTETPDNFDVLVSYVSGIDDDGQLGDFAFATFPARDLSLFAKFNPALTDRVLPANRKIRLSGFMGRLPDASARMVIVNTETRQYANGRGLQRDSIVLPCDSRPSNRWTLDVTLPSGNYHAFLRGVVPENGQYQFAPTELQFQVR